MKKNHFRYIFAILFTLVLLIGNITIPIYATGEAPVLTSPDAVVIDGTSGQILFEQNAHVTSYPASITKLMTALLALESLKAEDEITFSYDAIHSLDVNASQIGIQEGEVLSFDQAMYGMMLMSANEIANGIAERVSGSMDAFVEKMNQKAESIGALNSHFANPSGQDDPDQYTTPYDMALITKELIKDDYFLQVMANSTYEIPSTNLVDEVRYLSQQHLMLNTKKDLTVYREDVIAGKTGYTDAAKCTLVTVAKRENQIFIVVIMKSETFTNAYKDTANLLDYCFEHYTASQLEPGAYQTEIPVADSAGNNVGKAVLALTDGILLELPSESGEIRYEKNIPLSIESSKAIGDQVGTATIYAGSQILLNAPLFITDMKVELAESTTEATVAKAPEAIKKKGNFPFLLVLLLILALLIGAYLFYDKYFNRNWYSKRKNSR